MKISKLKLKVLQLNPKLKALKLKKEISKLKPKTILDISFIAIGVLSGK
jgi:hypothetical protein